MSILPNPKYVYKSAVTGEFVSWLYAKLHPRTTYRTLRVRREPIYDVDEEPF